MAFEVGKLRHRITIQRPVDTQDTTTGAMVRTWANVVENEPASVAPLSVRELISAQAVGSQITLRVMIRYRTGLTSDMRIVHGSKIYGPQGWLPDADSGLEYLTAPCREGLAEE